MLLLVFQRGNEFWKQFPAPIVWAIYWAHPFGVELCAYFTRMQYPWSYMHMRMQAMNHFCVAGCLKKRKSVKIPSLFSLWRSANIITPAQLYVCIYKFAHSHSNIKYFSALSLSLSLALQKNNKEIFLTRRARFRENLSSPWKIHLL